MNKQDSLPDASSGFYKGHPMNHQDHFTSEMLNTLLEQYDRLWTTAGEHGLISQELEQVDREDMPSIFMALRLIVDSHHSVGTPHE